MAFSFALSCLRSYVLLRCNCMYVYLATNTNYTLSDVMICTPRYERINYCYNLIFCQDWCDDLYSDNDTSLRLGINCGEVKLLCDLTN